jgi:Tfp pilus assembly protein PilO
VIKAAAILDVAKKPVVLIGAAAVIVVVLLWLFVFFKPQTSKLATLESQRTSLQQTLAQDRARLQRVREESHHVGQIQAIDAELRGYVPATEQLYTYIQAISGAGNKASVSITSLEPSTAVAASGSSYTAIPIDAEVKGTYDQLLAFLNAIYNLPRLTDINSVDITGGGPGTNRSTVLSATLDLVIFTSQKAVNS